MRKYLLALGGFLTLAAIAYAADAEKVDRINSPQPQYFPQGLYVGAEGKNPTGATANKLTAIAVRTYAHATPLVDGGTCAGAVLGLSTLTGANALAQPGDACIVKSTAAVQGASMLTPWLCDVTDAGTVTVQRCNPDTLTQQDAGVGDTLHITVFSHQ